MIITTTTNVACCLVIDVAAVTASAAVAYVGHWNQNLVKLNRKEKKNSEVK